MEEYRVHVKFLNHKNDKDIADLRVEKKDAKTIKVIKEKAKKIATISREKTARNRRLDDRERFHI